MDVCCVTGQWMLVQQEQAERHLSHDSSVIFFLFLQPDL
jgi:hypothetical protein